MNQINKLFAGYGIPVKQVEGGYEIEYLNEMNVTYAFDVMDRAQVDYQRTGERSFILYSSSIDKGNWVRAVQSLNDYRTEMLFRTEDLPLWKLDVNIAGLVIQFNRLGLLTMFSCDGHGSNHVRIQFGAVSDAELALLLVTRIGIQAELRGRMLVMRREMFVNLPMLAAYMDHHVEVAEQELFDKSFERFLFEQLLEELLQIPGESGREGKVRAYLTEELKSLGFNYTVDAAGNLLAEKKFGNGPVVLLNAHMDTVDRIAEGREIIKNGSDWSSSEGILGADDRAGIAAILMALKTFGRRDFMGTLKVIFTVEEETGLNGARAVNESFLWNTEAAFVLDRRGSGDLVTHNAFRHFCTAEFGEWLETIAAEEGFSEFRTVQGGSSDTAIWAAHGLQAVNMSIGYMNEHTEDEVLNVDDCFRSYQLLKVYVKRAREARRFGRRVVGR
ncbi:hypothetical protein KP77_34600 [Jeotgalibacillus alimentarius]|uniref:Peptidase M28 domain-containing protein n=1 Tax=Jeotgalibacillus alimentarius TaxID=135826 RepID=A0A0C2QXP9_9BACL|nr:M20/M25/M40 family metallo-hydrolase [Jeotgalibacillus alimentarius]KIL42830.1 hypothetical protein KP77_34600 [Jeotgalibacillus alimentarius]